MLKITTQNYCPNRFRYSKSLHFLAWKVSTRSLQAQNLTMCSFCVQLFGRVLHAFCPRVNVCWKTLPTSYLCCLCGIWEVVPHFDHLFAPLGTKEGKSLCWKTSFVSLLPDQTTIDLLKLGHFLKYLLLSIGSLLVIHLRLLASYAW